MILKRIYKGISRGFPTKRNLRFFLILCFLTIVTMLIIPQNDKYSECLIRGLKGPIAADDPELLMFIRNEVLEAPSVEPYNLTGKPKRKYLQVKENSEVFYKKHLNEIFKDKQGGFFIEVGALDGETMSNTLELEQKNGWRGLLVEPDTVSYKALKSKHRKAWSANVCLSPTPYPSQELFEERAKIIPTELVVPVEFKQRAMNTLFKFADKKSLRNGNWAWVQCLSLQSLLFALEVSKVDLLVLDVEGAEMSILQHFDFQKTNIEVICLEYKKIAERDTILKLMEEKGFQLLVYEVEDYIFAKTRSLYSDYPLF